MRPLGHAWPGLSSSPTAKCLELYMFSGILLHSFVLAQEANPPYAYYKGYGPSPPLPEIIGKAINDYCGHFNLFIVCLSQTVVRAACETVELTLTMCRSLRKWALCVSLLASSWLLPGTVHPTVSD